MIAKWNKSADPKETLSVQKRTRKNIIPRNIAQKFRSRLRRSYFPERVAVFPNFFEIYIYTPQSTFNDRHNSIISLK